MAQRQEWPWKLGEGLHNGNLIQEIIHQVWTVAIQVGCGDSENSHLGKYGKKTLRSAAAACPASYLKRSPGARCSWPEQTRQGLWGMGFCTQAGQLWDRDGLEDPLYPEEEEVMDAVLCSMEGMRQVRTSDIQKVDSGVTDLSQEVRVWIQGEKQVEGTRLNLGTP